MTNGFNLNQVINNAGSWASQKYTAQEIAEQAMAQRQIEKAKAAVESEQGFLGLTIQNKIKQMMVPEVVMQEIQDVAVKTFMGSLDPFFQWLEENEIAYSENMFEESIRGDAKKLFYTRLALQKEASKEMVGTNFSASY